MLAKFIQEHSKIIAECAIAERLRRMPEVTFHPTLYNAPLVYEVGRSSEAMAGIYGEYICAAAEARLPMLMTAPTWRVDPDRIALADPPVPESINTDAVNFMIKVREQSSAKENPPILIGALVGPKNDCYQPNLAPNAEEAERFHTPQINELASSKADFLKALTLPSVDEALGIARAMSATGKDYVISFCVGVDGNVLDGTSLPQAFEIIDNDSQITSPPTAYYVNCSHPSFITKRYQAGELDRLKGIQANGSSLDVTSLDGADCTQADSIESWRMAMSDLHKTHHLPILGGCCGTSLPHFMSLIKILKESH